MKAILLPSFKYIYGWYIFFFVVAIRINYERLKTVFLMFLCSQGLRHCFVGRSHRYGIGGASWEVQGPILRDCHRLKVRRYVSKTTSAG